MAKAELTNITITANVASLRMDVRGDPWGFIWFNSLMNDLAETASQRGKQRKAKSILHPFSVNSVGELKLRNQSSGAVVVQAAALYGRKKTAIARRDLMERSKP